MIADIRPDAARITVRNGTTEEVIDLRSVLAINQQNLPQEFTDQPSLFAWYGVLLADQQAKLAFSEKDRDRYAAELSIRFRKEAVTLKEKVTEAQLEAKIKLDDKYTVLDDQVIILNSVCKRLEVLVKASVQRKDMLEQLGMLARQEFKQFHMSRGIRE